MRADELRNMTPEDRAQRLGELRHELMNLRFQAATRQLADTSRLKQVRRDIARVQTVIREFELETEER